MVNFELQKKCLCQIKEEAIDYRSDHTYIDISIVMFFWHLKKMAYQAHTQNFR
jgi:hypothetical protein